MEFAGPLVADDPRHYQARPGVGEANLRLAELGVRGRDGDVAQQGDLASATHRVALYRRDDRLAQVPVGQHELEALGQHGVPPQRVPAVDPLARLRIGPGDVEAHAEASTLRAQHHHAGGLVGLGGPQRVPPGVHQPWADGVELLGPVDGDDPHRAIGLVQHQVIGHRSVIGHGSPPAMPRGFQVTMRASTATQPSPSPNTSTGFRSISSMHSRSAQANLANASMHAPSASMSAGG